MVLGLAAALAVAVYVTKVPSLPEQGPKPHGRAGRGRDAQEPRLGPERPAVRQEPGQGRCRRRRPSRAARSAAAGAGADGGHRAPRSRRHRAAGRRPRPAATRPADPLGDLAAARSHRRGARGADPFLYFVQAGAFRTPEDAEAQRAKLSLMGIDAKVTEREQSGRQVFRVRVGPFDKKEDADRHKEKLDAGGVETALVRVQR